MTLRVLLVDDTLTSRQLLAHIVNHSGDMKVVGEANNGEQAVKLAQDIKADVLLMDIIMPKMDGLEATRQIMQKVPLPIVLITASLESRETDIAFRAMKAGALTVLQKPSMLNPSDVNHIRTTLRAMSSVQVIHHFNRQEESPSNRKLVARINGTSEPRIVAIATSTGGPAALATILKELKPDFPLPIVIVQHISPDFVQSLRDWLQTTTSLNIQIANPGDYPEPGNVYLAPANAHLYMKADTRFAYDTVPGKWRYVPSCDVLLHSVAQTYGSHAIGIVLTGMGDDGADGLRALHEKGAITIAQDEDSSVVYGMPAAAVERGGAQVVLPLNQISIALNKIVMQGEYS